MALRNLAEMSDASAKTESLSERYLQVRRATEELCSQLTPEDCMVQSMPEASPTKWHLAHTTWFFETFILDRGGNSSTNSSSGTAGGPKSQGYQPLNPDYRYLFNSYYNAVGERPLRQVRGAFSRPSFEEVRAYRRHVDDSMLQVLEGRNTAEVAGIVMLGINHEQQHQELIATDAKHALWMNPLRPAFRLALADSDKLPRLSEASGSSADANGAGKTPRDVSAMNWFSCEPGLRKIGHAGDSFGFDNEFPRHDVYVQGFQLGSRLVTNGEYLEFMADGAYRRPELWLSDGWDVSQAHEWKAPLYWEQGHASRADLKPWKIYTCAGVRELNLDEPVCHVSFYEAEAYARWAGARLATEAEWEIAAAAVTTSKIYGNFLEDGALHPRPARARNPQESAPLQQVFGDVWEWTQSPYVAYPGYRPAAGALGEYNAKFMCNQMVLRGGSCASPRSHIRASYRNFFPPQARWQFSGIRLAKDVPYR